MKKSIVTAIVLIVSVCTASFAQTPSVVVSPKAGWHKITSHHANYKIDKDEILVMGNDRFKEIKLRAKDNSVELSSFNIYFEGDTVAPQVVKVPKTLARGEETKSVAVDRTTPIKKIVLIYKTTAMVKDKDGRSEKERAEVEVWGLK